VGPPAEDIEHRISRIATLDQPVRRDLYRLAAERGRLTRDEAADALGLPRSVAAFHLDKLAESRLLDVAFERTSGRSGPGAGRPSKVYSPSDEETSVSLPDRHYDLAGSLLAAAIDESMQTGTPIADALAASARVAGKLLGEDATTAVGARTTKAARRDAVLEVLARHGYEPQRMRGGEIALANCPFHRLAEQHRTLVCGMNLDFLSGLLQGMGPTDKLSARLEPEPGYCCVRIATS
jgi:predicted ArsR family transcriptional regulator